MWHLCFRNSDTKSHAANVHKSKKPFIFDVSTYLPDKIHEKSIIIQKGFHPIVPLPIWEPTLATTLLEM